jgi:hypothetical protein
LANFIYMWNYLFELLLNWISFIVLALNLINSFINSIETLDGWNIQDFIKYKLSKV